MCSSISIIDAESFMKSLWWSFDRPIISTSSVNTNDDLFITSPNDYLFYDIVVYDHMGIIKKFQNVLQYLGVNVALFGRDRLGLWLSQLPQKV